VLMTTGPVMGFTFWLWVAAMLRTKGAGHHLRITEISVRRRASRVRPYTASMRILVVEDEQKVALALREGLEAEHFEVRIALTGEEGFFLANEQPFDLVLLDLMLPRRNGIDILTTLRKRGINTPVLILTAKDTVEDRVYGLDKGADDYLVKPFAFSEVLARIRALLRRGHGDKPLLQCDGVKIDRLAHKASRDDQAVDLTPKEFDVLEYLLRHHGQAVSREMLARDVWHVTARATPLDNVIDVTIARLRRKIDEPFEPKLLRTVRGVGFMFGAHDD
jgi:two-component system copper resistance phosphate regulon response regulator CusR